MCKWILSVWLIASTIAFGQQSNYTAPGIRLGSVTAPSLPIAPTNPPVNGYFITATGNTTKWAPISSSSLPNPIVGNGSGISNILRGFITPYECGAVGDATTDDTVALQIWLDRAGTNGLIAFLPPAVGAYYKITDTLWVTNVAVKDLHILGTAGIIHTSDGQGTTGPNHMNGPGFTRSRIFQATAGKSGIVFTNTPSGVTIENIMISAPTAIVDGTVLPVAGTRGIAFDGSGSDSDCVLIKGCGINGFDAGLFIASGADVTVLQCSIGGNNDGVYIGYGTHTPVTAVINQITLRGCQLSYNYSNQLHQVYAANTLVDSSDIAQTGPTTPHAVGVWISKGGMTVQNCNLENDYNDQPNIIASAASAGDANLVLRGGGSQSSGAARNYTVIATNAFVTVEGCNMTTAADGYPIYYVGDPSQVVSSKYLKYKLLSGGTEIEYYSQSFVPTVGSHATIGQTEKVMQIHSAIWGDNHESLGGDDNTTADLIGARNAGFARGSATTVEVDRLQYWKDLITVIPAYRVMATNGFYVRSTGALYPSNATASTMATLGADNTLTNLNAINAGTALQLTGNQLKPITTEILTNGASQNVTFGGALGVTNSFSTYVNNKSSTSVSNITLGASPYSWTNNLGCNVFVVVDGGTAYSAKWLDTTVQSSLGGGVTLPLQPGEWAVVTYTVAPSMFVKKW